MRRSWLAISILFCLAETALADSAALEPQNFKTAAKFSVDDVRLSLASAVATIEARAGAPGYSWLRIYFYAFRPDADDVAGAMTGSVASMDQKWNAMASRPAEYNVSRATLQLTVDSSARVTQVDMSIPGHGCTIAPFEPEVARFLQDYRLDGGKLRLRSKGSYVCDMAFMHIPNQTFTWDVDLELPVFAKAK